VAQKTGVGMMRPFCLTNPAPRWQNKQDAWYLGSDLLVFPVMRPGVQNLRVDIPEGKWVHLFSRMTFGPGTYHVVCPIGQPAIFYRSNSPFEDVFTKIPISHKV